MATVVAIPDRVGIVSYLRLFARWYRTGIAVAATTGAFGLLFLADDAYASHRQAVLRQERLAEASKLFGPTSPYARFHLDATGAAVVPFPLGPRHLGRELIAVAVVALLLAILVHRRRNVWAAITMLSISIGVAIGAGPLANLVQRSSLLLIPSVPLPFRRDLSPLQEAQRLASTFELSTFSASSTSRAIVAGAVFVLLSGLVVVVRRFPTPTSPGVAPVLLDFVALNYTIGAFVLLLLCWPLTDAAILFVSSAGSGAAREFYGSLAVYAVVFAAGIVAIRATRVRRRGLLR